MLKIWRVPTLVSNFMDEDGCGRNCLGGCCLPSSKLSLYAFKPDSGPPASTGDLPSDFFLHTLLLGQWEDRMRKGLFRYDVTTCETKVIPGKHGFIAQLNEGRHLKKRPTEFRVDQVLQPFDTDKFNFTKVGQEEVLFRFEPSIDGKSKFSKSAVIDSNDTPNVVAINVSPIEYGHVLLIPRVFDCMPQRIDRMSFELAVRMAAEAGSPYFRLGYNSLGAFATINHLHFQAYYLSAPFPVEKALTGRLMVARRRDENSVVVSQILDYPVRGLVFEAQNPSRGLADVVADACVYLQENNIPFNVLISDLGRRIFLFPQCYAEKQALGQVSKELLDTQVNPAVWEISGHMVLKRRKDYEEASEEYAWRLLSEVSLSEERFEETKASIFEATGLTEYKDGGLEREEEASVLQPLAPMAVHFPESCLVLQ